MNQDILGLIIQLKDDFHNGHKEINNGLVDIRVQMQRNTDSLIHHEERTSLLHEEVNLLKQSLKIQGESLEKLQRLVEITATKEDAKKKTKKEIWGFWLVIISVFAQMATVGSFVAYVIMN